MKSLLNKRIAIFGAGAVGSYIGVKFINAGFTNVEFIARSSYDNLKEKGVEVHGVSSAPYNLSINVEKSLNGLYDIIFLCTKSKDTIIAGNIIKDHLSPNGYVASIQNGVDNPHLLASIIEKEKVIANVIYLTAVMKKKHILSYSSECRIVFGSITDTNPYLDEYKQILDTAGLNNKLTDNIKEAQWQKLMLNIVLNPLTALFRKTFAKMSESKEALVLAHNLFMEARQAAAFNGVDIPEKMYESIVKGCSIHTDFKSSMYQDIEANRNPEIDSILGVVINSFHSKGLKAPYTESVYNIMKVKYGSWFQISPTLASDILVINGDKVLLIDRANEPLGWAIPGGLVDLYESLEEAGVRELYEETGIKADITKIELLGVYSNPARDPRGHTVSAVYVYFSSDEPVPADDAKGAEYFSIYNLPENLAFDHKQILEDCRKKYFNK